MSIVFFDYRNIEAATTICRSASLGESPHHWQVARQPTGYSVAVGAPQPRYRLEVERIRRRQFAMASECWNAETSRCGPERRGWLHCRCSSPVSQLTGRGGEEERRVEHQDAEMRRPPASWYAYLRSSSALGGAGCDEQASTDADGHPRHVLIILTCRADLRRIP